MAQSVDNGGRSTERHRRNGRTARGCRHNRSQSGFNDPAAAITRIAFDHACSRSTTPGGPPHQNPPARQAIARGQSIFNTRPIQITTSEA